MPAGPDAGAPGILAAKGPPAPTMVGEATVPGGVTPQSAPFISGCTVTGSTYTLPFYLACSPTLQPTPIAGGPPIPASLTITVLGAQLNTAKQITMYQVRGVDANGTRYESEWILLESPVTPNPSLGFTVHVNGDNVPMWERSGPQNGAKRVRVIGTIGLWDVVYSPAP